MDNVELAKLVRQQVIEAVSELNQEWKQEGKPHHVLFDGIVVIDGEEKQMMDDMLLEVLVPKFARNK